MFVMGMLPGSNYMFEGIFPINYRNIFHHHKRRKKDATNNASAVRHNHHMCCVSNCHNIDRDLDESLVEFH